MEEYTADLRKKVDLSLSVNGVEVLLSTVQHKIEALEQYRKDCKIDSSTPIPLDLQADPDDDEASITEIINEQHLIEALGRELQELEVDSQWQKWKSQLSNKLRTLDI